MSSERATICQILHSLRVGGAEMLAARLARRLRDRYQFVFVCLDEVGTLGEELRNEGFTVHELRRRPGVDWRGIYRLSRFLRQQQVDLIHAHQYTPFFYGIASRLLYRRPPVLFTEHGRHLPDYPRRKRILVNRLLLERRDRVMGVGETVRQALIRNEGIPAERVATVYNGINLEPYKNGTGRRDDVRAELGIGQNDLSLILVARLDYLKDHATAVRTLSHVRRSYPGARLLFVGEGPELSKIKTVTAELGLQQSVHLLGLRTDVPRLLRVADVFLLTSISEGIPLTVIEAMAAGLPVVATDVGGLSEVVENGSTGFLAPAGDDPALADCVLRIAGDPELRQSMAQNGKIRADAKFSESQMHSGYVAIYEEMLHG